MTSITRAPLVVWFAIFGLLFVAGFLLGPSPWVGGVELALMCSGGLWLFNDAAGVLVNAEALAHARRQRNLWRAAPGYEPVAGPYARGMARGHARDCRVKAWHADSDAADRTAAARVARPRQWRTAATPEITGARRRSTYQSFCEAPHPYSPFHGGKRYIHRDKNGRFREQQVDVGRSLWWDARSEAKQTAATGPCATIRDRVLLHLNGIDAIILPANAARW